MNKVSVETNPASKASVVKRFVMWVWLRIPFGYICKFEYGDLTVTLKKNLWLVISDGHSNDALPINLVSQELVDECEKQMMMRGYT